MADKSANIREVKVLSPYLDNSGAEYLIKMLKNKVKIKLITRKPDKKQHIEALDILRKHGAEVKYDKMLHARLIIFDDIAAIISSADLDGEGLNNQRQAGIFTTDKIIIKDAITFFDKIWDLLEDKNT
ncbi:MAG: phospholipase D family protein [archaeon GB-1845-036]|nr:phospholipase D family protein [Candidatus Culexmicrobium thermophilum]